MTNVDNSEEQRYSRFDQDMGGNTQDRVFLLSFTEAHKYFKSDYDRTCAASIYTNRKGARNSTNGKCWWWLRSQTFDNAKKQNLGMFIDANGSIYCHDLKSTNTAVRPAFWLDLNSLTL